MTSLTEQLIEHLESHGCEFEYNPHDGELRILMNQASLESLIGRRLGKKEKFADAKVTKEIHIDFGGETEEGDSELVVAYDNGGENVPAKEIEDEFWRKVANLGIKRCGEEVEGEETYRTEGFESEGEETKEDAENKEKDIKKEKKKVKNAKKRGFYIYVYMNFMYEEKPARAITSSTYSSLKEFRECLDVEENRLDKLFADAIADFKDGVNFSEYSDAYDGKLTIVLRDDENVKEPTGYELPTEIGVLKQIFVDMGEKRKEVEIDENN